MVQSTGIPPSLAPRVTRHLQWGFAPPSGPLAQLAEQQTLNLRVEGSIPSRLTTNQYKDLPGWLLQRVFNICWSESRRVARRASSAESSSHDQPDGALTHAVFPRECGLKSSTLYSDVPPFADRSHVRIGQTRVVVVLPCAMAPRSSLGLHVAGVVKRCAEEQMIGPHTSPIVASVEHRQSRADRPSLTRPSEAVCAKRVTIHADTAIPVLPSAPAPFPTTGEGELARTSHTFHLGPESGV